MPDRNSRPAPLAPQDAYRLWAAAYPAHAHNPFMMAEERALLSLLPNSLRKRHVLDVGCGTGRYLSHALRRHAAAAVGVDQSPEMLLRGQKELTHALTRVGLQSAEDSDSPRPVLHWALAHMESLPIKDQWADVTICALALGHLPNLRPALAELGRVTRSGGSILCSDFHPAGHALGWQRTFTANGEKYAVQHTPHSHADWRRACEALSLTMVSMLEPQLDPADISIDARFDHAALSTPVAVIYQLAVR